MSDKAKVVESAEIEETVEDQPPLEPAQQASQQLLEIRDLLFGEQLRSVQLRADEMETHLQTKL